MQITVNSRCIYTVCKYMYKYKNVNILIAHINCKITVVFLPILMYQLHEKLLQRYLPRQTYLCMKVVKKYGFYVVIKIML